MCQFSSQYIATVALKPQLHISQVKHSPLVPLQTHKTIVCFFLGILISWDDVRTSGKFCSLDLHALPTWSTKYQMAECIRQKKKLNKYSQQLKVINVLIIRTLKADPKKQHSTAFKDAYQATKPTTNHLCGERNNVCFLFLSIKLCHDKSALKKNFKEGGEWGKVPVNKEEAKEEARPDKRFI